MGRSRRHHARPEPPTSSQAALRAWLHGPPRRPQILLAVVCRVSQQLISAYANRRLRPDPGSEAARLLEIATGGRVTPSGWMTPEELFERDQRNAQAAAFARAMASGARVELVAATVDGGRRPDQAEPQSSRAAEASPVATRRAS